MWKNKTVLVTGGAGFLGRHLVRMLVEAGAKVFVPRSYNYDLRDQDDVDKLFYDLDPIDIVFHLAANVGGIGVTKAHPGKTFYDNAMMGLNVIEACRQHGVGKVVVAGSVCAYPLYCPVPMVERNLWEGYPETTNAPYGVAKRMLSTMLDAYRQEYGLNGVYVLLANMYGPGDNFDPDTSHVIPALIRKCTLAKETGADHIDVWGSGKASRDFLFVGDAARALMLAAEHYESSEPINVGSGEETQIAGLVEMVKAATGYTGGVVYDTTKPDGQPRRRLNIWKAQSELEWAPQWTLARGLAETVEWYTQRNINAHPDSDQ